MYYFLAHKKLLSRMLDLGLFDELFASIEKYTAGDANACLLYTSDAADE